MYFVVKQDFVKSNVAPEQMKPHVDYMHSLIDSGQVVVSGPFSDKSGGLFILETENEQEASKIASNDPAVVSGILANDIRPYQLAYLKNN